MSRAFENFINALARGGTAHIQDRLQALRGEREFQTQQRRMNDAHPAALERELGTRKALANLQHQLEDSRFPVELEQMSAKTRELEALRNELHPGQLNRRLSEKEALADLEALLAFKHSPAVEPAPNHSDFIQSASAVDPHYALRAEAKMRGLPALNIPVPTPDSSTQKENLPFMRERLRVLQDRINKALGEMQYRQDNIPEALEKKSGIRAWWNKETVTPEEVESRQAEIEQDLKEIAELRELIDRLEQERDGLTNSAGFLPEQQKTSLSEKALQHTQRITGNRRIDPDSIPSGHFQKIEDLLRKISGGAR